jgi:uncharacterized protein DUF805
MNPLKLLWSFYGRIGRGTFAGGNLRRPSSRGLWSTPCRKGPSLPGALPNLLVTLSPLLALRIGGALVLLLIWAQLALAAKRFHDVGKAGWSCLLLFVPLVGLIAFIYLLFARGEDRDNQYGPGRSAPSAGTRPAWRSFGWCRDDALDETGLLPGRSGAQFGPTAWVELNTLVAGVRPAPYFR